MQQTALQLLDYHHWANRTIIEHIHTLPEGVLTKEVNSVFSSLEQVLLHMLAADNTWLTRLNGHSPSQLKAESAQGLDELKHVFERQQQQWLELIGNEQDLARSITYSNTRGDQFTNTIFEIVQHVANHGTYHRGNITAMLRQMGHKGASTDYIVYLRTKA